MTNAAFLIPGLWAWPSVITSMICKIAERSDFSILIRQREISDGADGAERLKLVAGDLDEPRQKREGDEAKQKHKSNPDGARRAG